MNMFITLSILRYFFGIIGILGLLFLLPAIYHMDRDKNLSDTYWWWGSKLSSIGASLALITQVLLLFIAQ